MSRHVALVLCLLAGCGEASHAGGRPPSDAGLETPSQGAEPELRVPRGRTVPAFCARSGVAANAIRDVFCGSAFPEINNLADLQSALEVKPGPAGSQPVISDPYSAVKFIVATGHSTALSGHSVSPINPRLIVIGRDTILAFQRGVQRVELATRVRGAPNYSFYLVNFAQACNDRDEGCLPGDLFTPRIENEWTGFEVLDEDELKNTPNDCRQCHQRTSGAGVLLMRELQAPWTHFFEPRPKGDIGTSLPGIRGYDLVADYVRAKGDELYGNADVAAVPPTSAFVLQSIVGQQPLFFDAKRIELERWPYGEAGYPADPQPSPTWDAAYEAFKRGEQLALPHFDPRVSDPDKQLRLTDAYARYRAGELAAEDLPDLSDIFPDDPETRAKIGLATEPDSAPADALIQACGSCHNDVLDQTISRARFNINLARLDRAELAVAIDRISRPRSAPGAMPPPESRQLDDASRANLLEYLRAHERDRSRDADLARAAELGMAGGAQVVVEGGGVY